MRKGAIAVLGFGVLLGVACGSDDKTVDDSQKACDEFHAKLNQCGLVSNQPCSGVSTCLLRCQANASCEALTTTPPTGEYLDCQAGCQGIDPNPFVCTTGKSFIDRRGRCDGVATCPDGSDEVGCSDGGAAGGAANGGASNGGGGQGSPGGASADGG